MQVFQIISQANPEAVIAAYIKAYDEDTWCKVETFNKFREQMLACIPVLGHYEYLAVDWCETLYADLPERNGGGWEKGWNVGAFGKDEDGKPTNFGVSFEQWSRLRNLEVKSSKCVSTIHNNRIESKNEPFEVQIDELAAHIYYEFTFHGWQEDAIEKREMLIDKVEEVERVFDNTEPGRIPEGFMTLDDFLKEIDDDD